jgi:flagellar biosynthesis regulator FlaF
MMANEYSTNYIEVNQYVLEIKGDRLFKLLTRNISIIDNAEITDEEIR